MSRKGDSVFETQCLAKDPEGIAATVGVRMGLCIQLGFCSVLSSRCFDVSGGCVDHMLIDKSSLIAMLQARLGRELQRAEGGGAGEDVSMAPSWLARHPEMSLTPLE